ncbi:hypothetical protein G1E_34920 [Pseudomonas sp. TJI-51]|nr:hypothetical protein G1E_34920 [Pseudomonas sp. TJI-51]
MSRPSPSAASTCCTAKNEGCRAPHVGAALCRDGLQSSPRVWAWCTNCRGCFAAHRDTRPLLQGQAR